MTETTTEPSADVQLEVRIAASPERVWQALTDGAGEWWPAEFYIGGEEGKRSYHLEARPGGRVYEEWDSGGGLLWGLVTTAVPGQLLQVNGFSFPEWGGPSIMFAAWRLTSIDDGCSLNFTEHAVGTTPEHYAAKKEKGWTFLMDVMTAHIEGTEPPEWQG